MNGETPSHILGYRLDAAADYLDDQTILEKLPFVTVDEVDAILARKDAESYSRFEDDQENDDENAEE